MNLRIGGNLALPREAVTQTFAILAKRGAGKTYTAAVMAEEMLKASLPVVIADPIGVWWGLRAAADGKSDGLQIVVLGGDHGDAPLDATAGELVASLVVDERLSVVLDLSQFRKGEQTRFMTDFAERLYHRNRQALHLILDEADAFAPQRPMPGEQRLLGAVEDLVRRGRARGIGVTLVTQRAAVLNKNVLTQVEVLVTLRTIAPQDLGAVDEWIKVHGTPGERAELMASLPSLPIGTAWFWSPGWLDMFRRVAVRRRETFDSSATPKVGAARLEPKRLAAVDIEALKSRLAATIEKAKAEDPRELRRRIAALEADLRKAQTSAAPAADPEEIERARRAGRAEATAVLESIGQVLQGIENCIKGVEEEAANIRLNVVGARSRIEAFGADPAALVSPVDRGAAARPAPRPARQLPPPAPSGPAVPLPAGERATLTACAQYPDGVTRQQFSILTGYKRSTRDAYIQRLREKGYVEIEGDRVRATPPGVAALGDFEPLPTGRDLQKYWLARLPEGERAVLEVLVRAWPKAVPRDAIDNATGYKRSSRDAYIQRLKARQLVEIVGPGELRASEELF